MDYSSFLSALVGKGYFPKELPPTFTTESFGDKIIDILHSWQRDRVFTINSKLKLKRNKSKSGAYTYQLQYTDAEIISIPKRGFERRLLHITHPIPQALLSYEIAQNWRRIIGWLTRQHFSVDDFRISPQYPRAIKDINFVLHNAKKSFIEATSDWVVSTDISRFYPSIYTHSISWAAYGKEKVKANLRLYEGSLADRLDFLVRTCNRNQTIGLPIGPETSRIIANIISARIDDDFRNRMPKLELSRVNRLQDDWFVGVDSLEEAETVLANISAVYRSYALEINGSKTVIDHTLGKNSSEWSSEIGAFLGHREGPLRGPRLRELFNLGFRLQREHSHEPVLNYILSAVEAHRIDHDDVETIESFLLKAAVVSQASLAQISRMVLSLHHTKRLSTKRIADRFTKLAERAFEKGWLFEAIWLLYTIRGIRRCVNSKRIAELAESTPSSALALLLLDMKYSGLFVRSLPIAKWENQITPDRVRTDWIWLLGYEGIRNEWLSDRKNTMNDPFFRTLRQLGVIFYDRGQRGLSSKAYVQMRKNVQKKNMQALQRLMATLRGFTSI